MLSKMCLTDTEKQPLLKSDAPIHQAGCGPVESPNFISNDKHTSRTKSEMIRQAKEISYHQSTF